MVYLSVIIVGGGIAGLTAAIALRRKGHTVTVLEGARQLSEIGAGIQVPPNSNRVFHEFGIADKFAEKVVTPKTLYMRRYADGAVLSRTRFVPMIEEKFGYPYWLIFRADYQRLLYDAAVEIGADVRLGALVDSVDNQGPSVTLRGGEILQPDLVVGADGIKSRVRKAVLGEEITPRDSGYCCYRGLVPAEVMKSDPKTASFMENVETNGYMGPGRHIMGYPIKYDQLFNLVMTYEGELDGEVGAWTQPGDITAMREEFKDFDTNIRAAVEKLDSCSKWRICDVPPLKTWTGSGKVVIIGDAAHAMQAYLAQGAAMSVEDGVALAECLDFIKSKDEVHLALKAFEGCRKARCEAVQQKSRDACGAWHLPDGPEQEERDRQFKETLKEGATYSMPSKERTDSVKSEALDSQGASRTVVSESTEIPTDPQMFTDWVMGYDTFKVTRMYAERFFGVQQ